MEFCDICNVGRVTYPNVLFLDATDPMHPLKKVTKDICDKCFNEIKPNATDRIRRYNKAQTILDGEDRTGIVESREGM